MPLPDLPLDVLDLVCDFVDQHELVTVAASAPVLYPFAQHHLYRRIALANPKDAVRCLKTLQRSPHLARHVRSLSLRLDPCTPVLGSFVDLLASGLAVMVNLVTLDVVVPHNASRAFFAPEIYGSLYMRLTHFSCNLPLDDAICSFLQRVPAVKELQLGEYEATLPASMTLQSVPMLPATALPRLAFFMGPSDAATVLVPGRPLESVHLYPGDLSDEVLDALSRASSPITVLGALTHSLSPSTLQCLADSLPHLHFLRIMTMYHASNPPDESFYAQVVQILSALPDLVGAELAGFRWFSWKDTASAQGHTKPTCLTTPPTPTVIQDELFDEDAIAIGLY
ncbi:hypothetical protein ACEPAI_6230 [Sanghuangporus weigelae]